MHLPTNASGDDIPPYESADNRTKKNILYLAVTILVGALAALGLTGCSQTPKIYRMPADNLEEIRSGFGRIGVTFYSYEFKQVESKPAQGITGGAARGFVVGASTPVVIGAVAPVPGGTLMGLLVAPFTALAGGYMVPQRVRRLKISKKRRQRAPRLLKN